MLRSSYEDISPILRLVEARYDYVASESCYAGNSLFAPVSHRFIATLPLLLWLCGCGTQSSERAPAIGEAWAGPASLTIRREVDPKSPVAGVARHGEHLEITGTRRRWYKVRNSKGAEGWVDDRQLMDSAQMARLVALAKETAHLPSQGQATAFDTLNVHSEPNRLSASFIQVKEGEKFDVIAHRVHARAPLPRRQLLPPKPKAVVAKKPKKEPKIPPPPPPTPPAVPADWVELSRQAAQVPEEDLPPVARDDWTLIRTQNGQSGWVLTSRLFMGIPDEVAQYAEGDRIMAYFSLGRVMSRDGTPKDIWLWTTAESLGRDYDFDGYRIFTWNTRRERYETAYIQRRVRGFFPVLAKAGEFSVCVENAAGATVRKKYTMTGNSVRGADEEPCSRPTTAPGTATEAKIDLRPAASPQKGFFDRVGDQWRRLTGTAAK